MRDQIIDLKKHKETAEHVRTTFPYSGIQNSKKYIPTKKRKKIFQNMNNRGVAPCCGTCVGGGGRGKKGDSCFLVSKKGEFAPGEACLELIRPRPVLFRDQRE